MTNGPTGSGSPRRSPWSSERPSSAFWFLNRVDEKKRARRDIAEQVMDIARPSNLKQKRIKQGISATVAIIAVAVVTVGVNSLKPAAPTVEAATLWPDTVKRGPMVRQV